VGGESQDNEFLGAREASDEERAFHAQQTNGGSSQDEAPRESAAREASSESAAPERTERTERAEPAHEPARESRNEGTQAPLDLPPPPPSKPFVVWSSSPSDSPTPRRDE
jgi:hypothetical protein